MLFCFVCLLGYFLGKFAMKPRTNNKQSVKKKSPAQTPEGGFSGDLALPSDFNRAKAIKDIQDLYRAALKHSSESLTGYFNHVVIDSRPQPMLFREAAEPWQWFLASKIAPAIESVAGIRRDYKGPTRFWFTLPRGHDKTSSIGRLNNWLLSFARRRVSCLCAAGDREQASRLADFMQAEAALNPWLNDRLEFANYFVRGQLDSKLQIISADANSSFGDKSDLVICDELTHWEKGDLWDALYSGSLKRPNSVYIIITNAGLMHTWQWEQINSAKRNPDWYVFEAPGPLSRYMSPEKVAQLASEMPKGLADRVLWNKWLDPAEGCGFITPAEAQACEDRGVAHHLLPQVAGHSHQYVASVDYGPTKDRTVLTIAHRLFGKPNDGCVVVDRMDVFEGSQFPKGRVPIHEVDQWVDEAVRDFGATVVVDQYQMEASIQRYESMGYKVHRFDPRGGKSNHVLAMTMAALIQNGLLMWYKGCGSVYLKSRLGGYTEHTLVDEFSEIITKHMAYGTRLDHLPGKHDDRVISLGMACVFLAQEASAPVNYDDDRWF